MRAAEHYRAEVSTIPIGATALEAAQEMKSEEIGSLVVMDGKKPVGILTDRDLLCRVVAVGRDAETTQAKDIMSAPLVTADPRDPLERVVEKMSDNKVRRVPVVKDGRLRGLVSLDDALVALSEELGDLAEGARRSTRAARARRVAHEVESLIGDVRHQLGKLGEEAREGLEERLDSLRDRIGIRRH